MEHGTQVGKKIALMFCSSLFLVAMFALTTGLYWSWNDAIWEFGDEYCSENYERATDCEFYQDTGRGGYNIAPPFHYTDGPTMLDGYSSDHFLMLDGPWIWIGYFLLATMLSLGLCARGYRDLEMYALDRRKRLDESAIIPLLAIDPKCVIEGRVNLPESIDPLQPTRLEKLLQPTIIFVASLTILGTLISVLYEVFNKGLDDSYKIEIDNIELGSYPEFICSLAVMIWASLTAVMTVKLYRLFEQPVLSHSTSLLPAGLVNNASDEVQLELETHRQMNSNEPVRIDSVIKMLEIEMERARKETKRLEEELSRVNEKVVVLNTELEEKSIELEDMRKVKENMEGVMEKESEGEGKSLTMADSVLVGDALFGGTKIDHQIVNDPLAIARAAIEAYQQGKKDSDK